MTIVADTSALVSLGIVGSNDTDPLTILLDEQRVVIPERVRVELRDTAGYEDRSADGATTVLDHLSKFEVRGVELDEGFPLDDGENAAVSLANELNATQFLCDEFNELAIVHASLVDTRLLTTPTFLTALVQSGTLDPKAAETHLTTIRDARSWKTNSYVVRARATLNGMNR